MSKLRANRKRIFGVGVMIMLLTAVVIWQVAAREGQAQSGGGFSCPILNVTLDSGITLSGLTSAAGASTSDSSGGGIITTLDGEEVGRVRIWGLKRIDEVHTNIANGSPVNVAVATVNMIFELPGFNGTMVAQGVLNDVINDGIHGQVTITGGVLTFNGDDVIAITGGTGTFRGINGEALLQRKSDSSFTVWVKEGRRK